MRILFDSRWIAPHGIGRVAREYRDRLARDFDLQELSDGPRPSHPLDWLYLGSRFQVSGADLLVTPGYNGTPLAASRQIFIIHDLIHFEQNEPGGAAKRLYYNLFTRAATGRGTVVTVSQASADQIGRIWPETHGHVHVIPNGVAWPFVDPEALLSPERNGLVLFGNGRWHKNLKRSIEAVAIWQQSDLGTAATVTIVGAREPAASLAAEAGLRNVTFAGVLEDEALAQLLRRSAALLFCSLTEGFGLPLCEALVCGCPVVASDIPVLREIGGHGCEFVDPASAAAIARGIGRAIEQQVGQADRDATARAFDWDRSYEKLANLVRAKLSGAA